MAKFFQDYLNLPCLQIKKKSATPQQLIFLSISALLCKLYFAGNYESLDVFTTGITYATGSGPFSATILPGQSQVYFTSTLKATKSGMVYIEFQKGTATGGGFKIEWLSTGTGSYVKPKASFIADDSGCVVYPVAFKNTSVADYQFTRFSWDFDGNGIWDDSVVTTDTLVTHEWKYTHDSDYYAIVRVCDDYGLYKYSHILVSDFGFDYIRF
jgi:hypothetical protein